MAPSGSTGVFRALTLVLRLVAVVVLRAVVWNIVRSVVRRKGSSGFLFTAGDLTDDGG